MTKEQIKLLIGYTTEWVIGARAEQKRIKAQAIKDKFEALIVEAGGVIEALNKSL